MNAHIELNEQTDLTVMKVKMAADEVGWDMPVGWQVTDVTAVFKTLARAGGQEKIFINKKIYIIIWEKF